MMLVPRIVRQLALGCLAITPFLTPSLLVAKSYDFTPAQEARIRKLIPNTLAKFEKHQPVTVVAVGDSVMDFDTHTDDSGNALKSYEGVFIQMLADHFYYPGGVRLINAPKGMPDKIFNTAGLEVKFNNVSRGGKLMLHALQSYAADGMDPKPDLALVGFGINDAIVDVSLKVYRRALLEVIDFTRKNGIELLLFGPTLVMKGEPEEGFALTRPYSDVMREVAEANGIGYFDLGDLAWLVHIDDRSIPVQAPRADTKLADLKPAPLPVFPSPVQIPVGNDADPDVEKKALGFFSQVVEGYRVCIDWGPDNKDPLHPSAFMHRVLGRRVYGELEDGPKKVPWEISNASVTFDGGNKCVMSYRLTNPTDKLLRYYTLPLVTNWWKPQEAQTAVDLKAGGRTEVNVTYMRKGNLRLMPEPLLRMPVLIMGEGTARIETVRAPIAPVGVDWDTGTQFNLDGSFTVSGRLSNPLKTDADSTWEASWMGQTMSGHAHLDGKTTSTFRLTFKLPEKDSATTHEKGNLHFGVTTSGAKQNFDREIEVVRNVGLRQSIPMYLQDQYLMDQPMKFQVADATHAGITFRVDADPGALYLMWDVHGKNLQDDPSGKGAALGVELNIDARSYGKRLTPGSTDAIRTSCSAADGDANQIIFHPWMLGTGYTRDVNMTGMSAKLTSRPDGTRRFTMTIPRGMFYLHEWALGNGNSQLGIDTTFILRQVKATGSETPMYTIDHCPVYRDDVDSLMVLELTDKPTKRWTVRLY